MKKKTILLATLLVGCALGFFAACNNNNNKANQVPAAVQGSSNTCDCESIWFPHSSTPPPAEGKGSPFDTSSTTNCIFHQWSWQKFLWLTKPMASGHPLFQDSMIQVDANLTRVAPVTVNKVPIRLVLSDSAQAGSGGTLHTNPNYSANKQANLVYYSIFVDNTLLQFADSIKKVLVADTNALNNLFTFPIGALELKISWVNINSIPQAEQSSYYTTDAAVPSGSGYQTMRVALLGMHVVGRVINHPEFIWATFEHHDMAPYYDWKKTTSQQDAPITSSSDKLLFAKGSTEGLGGITWSGSAPDSLYKVYTLYKYGVPRVAGDNFMSGTSQSEPINYNNIDGLNMCVAAKLDANDVWRNYFYNGSIWINTDGLSDIQQSKLIDSLGFSIGNADSGSSARGSLNAFNLTMETYVQTGASNTPNVIHTINVNDLTNCFSCHTGASSVTVNGKKYSGKKSPLYVSHIFKNSLNTGASLSTSKKEGMLHFQQVMKLLQRR